jgi:hypothetical protein
MSNRIPARQKRAANKGLGDDEADAAARQRRNLGGWHDPGNSSSHPSALIWSAQLILFDSVTHVTMSC